MKKIIAAALSVLLGTVGLTVVDKTIESRVATLESEVVELREEVSNYHITNVSNSTPILESMPDNASTEISGIATHTTASSSYFPTIISPSSPPIPGTDKSQGDYLYEESVSRHKFLLMKYSDGRVVYVSPDNLENYTTSDNPPEEIFLNITENYAQWTETEEEISYSYGYDQDYSYVSTPHTTTNYYITVRFIGNTDPRLAGTKIDFALGSDLNRAEQINISNNVIDENGCFDFTVVYRLSDIPGHYRITAIEIL